MGEKLKGLAGGLTGRLPNFGALLVKLKGIGKLGALFGKLGAPLAKLKPLLSKLAPLGGKLGPLLKPLTSRLAALRDKLLPAVDQLESQFHHFTDHHAGSDDAEEPQQPPAEGDEVFLPPEFEQMVEHAPEKKRTALMAGLGVLGIGFLIGLGIWLLSGSRNKGDQQTADSNVPSLSLPMPPRAGPGSSALLNPPPPSSEMTPSALPPAGPAPETPPPSPGAETSQAPAPAQPPPAQPGAEPPRSATGPETPPAPPGPEAQAAKPALSNIQVPPLRETGGVKLTSLSPVAGQPTLPSNSGPLSVPKFTDLPKPQPPAQPVPMPEAPQSALLRKTGAGAVPTVAPDGREPWKTYARPFDLADKRPRIAVVIYGLGLQKEAADSCIQLMPPEVTLSFSPYALKVDELVKHAHEAGHETLIDMPLDSTSFPYRDPGPLGLISTLSSSENQSRLQVLMSKAQGYNGFVAVDGQRFLASQAQVDDLFRELKKSGLLFVDDGMTASPVAQMNAESLELPYAKASIMIDDRHFKSAIDIRLRKAEDDAHAKGRALVLIPAKPLAMARVAAWVQDLSTRGIALAPVSAVVTAPQTAAPAAGEPKKGSGHE